MKYIPGSRRFKYGFHFVNWDTVSLGLSVGFGGPHIELHVPFGFFQVGWYGVDASEELIEAVKCGKTTWPEVVKGITIFNTKGKWVDVDGNPREI
jgi:hypothetical protein